MDAVPAHDHRPLGVGQRPGRGVDVPVGRPGAPAPGLLRRAPQRRRRVVGHLAGHRVAVEDDRGRAGPAGGRVLEREADAPDRLGGRPREPVLLRDGVEDLRERQPAVVAAGLLVGRDRRVVAALGGLGEHDHRRRAQAGLHLADGAEAPDPGPLADQHAGRPGEPAVDLGHDARLALVARADDVDLGVGERLEQLDHPAARVAEHPGHAQLLEHPGDGLGGGGHRLRSRAASSRSARRPGASASPPGARPRAAGRGSRAPTSA